MERDYVFNHRSATAHITLEDAARRGIEPREAIPAIIRTALTGSGWELVGITGVDVDPEEGSYLCRVGFIARESDEPRIHALTARRLHGGWEAEMTEEAALSILRATGWSWADGLGYADDLTPDDLFDLADGSSHIGAHGVTPHEEA